MENYDVFYNTHMFYNWLRQVRKLKKTNPDAMSIVKSMHGFHHLIAATH